MLIVRKEVFRIYSIIPASNNRQLSSITLTYKKIRKIKSRPVSRVLYPRRDFYHLSGIDVATNLLRPTPHACLRTTADNAVSRRISWYTWSYNPSDARLLTLPSTPVGSCPTFSPLPRPKPRRLFSVPLLYPCGYLPVRKDGALCCPDFPPRQRRSDRTAYYLFCC